MLDTKQFSFLAHPHSSAVHITVIRSRKTCYIFIHSVLHPNQKYLFRTRQVWRVKLEKEFSSCFLEHSSANNDTVKTKTVAYWLLIFPCMWSDRTSWILNCSSGSAVLFTVPSTCFIIYAHLERSDLLSQKERFLSHLVPGDLRMTLEPWEVILSMDSLLYSLGIMGVWNLSSVEERQTV